MRETGMGPGMEMGAAARAQRRLRVAVCAPHARTLRAHVAVRTTPLPPGARQSPPWLRPWHLAWGRTWLNPWKTAWKTAWKTTWALVREPLAVWAMTRVALFVVAYVAVLFLTASVQQTHLPVATRTTVLSPLDVLARFHEWDAGYYQLIAQRGYFTSASAAFFPLYPLLVKGGLLLSGGQHGGLVELAISNLASLAALIGLARLAAKECGIAASRLSLWVLLCYPLAFFLAVGYADSLFLALAVWCVYAARARRWTLVVVLGILAGLARATALVLVLPLAWEYGVYAVERGWLTMTRTGKPSGMPWWRPRRMHLTTSRHDALVLGGAALGTCTTPILGVLCYALYCQRRWGNAWAFLAAERTGFGHTLLWPWQAVGYAAGQLAHLPTGGFDEARVLVDTVPLVLAIALTLGLTIWAGRGPARLPFSFTLYTSALLLLIVCTPITHAQFPEAYVSAGRYLLAAFPLWLATGRLLAARPALAQVVLYAGTLLQALLFAFYLSGGWLV